MRNKLILAVLLLAMLSLSACFSPIYRYSYVKNTNIEAETPGYQLKEVSIENAELLLLDSAVISNSLVNITEMVMENNGLSPTSNATLGVSLRVLIEDNDIINNKQSLSVVYIFLNNDREFARFILSSSSKNILLDKALLVKELNRIILKVKAKLK